MDETAKDKAIEVKHLEAHGLVKIPAGCWFAVEMDPQLGDYCLSTVLLCPGEPVEFRP